MIKYLKGSGGLKRFIDDQKRFNPPRLFSYFFLIAGDSAYGEMDRLKDLIRLKGTKQMKKKLKLFLDSGAYSAFTKGITIDIHEYIAFIKENAKHIEIYSVLDSIGDPEMTWKNQKIMERHGLKPIPCYHYGEPETYIKRYVQGYPYISLGGMVGATTPVLMQWLDRIFRDYICDSKGIPKVKVHGFGITAFDLMWRYPWFSVDSAAWVFTGRNGAIFVPRWMGGIYNYQERPWVVSISEQSGERKKLEGKHFNSFSKSEQQQIVKYIQSKGFELGEESDPRPEPPDYVLKKGERWSDKSKTKVIAILSPGAKTTYQVRDSLNIQYYLDLMDAYNRAKPWPWAFKTSAVGFGLTRKIGK